MRFLSELKFERLPSSVIERTKMHILDTLGCAIAGARSPEGTIIARIIQSLDKNGEATVIGNTYTASCINAALVNATAGHALEFDDLQLKARVHPGVIVVPAAISVAERVGAGGETLIVAVVAGYEAMIRVAYGLSLEIHEDGFYPTGLFGIFGAAAAASKVLDLTDAKMASALGLAGVQSSGLSISEYSGAMSKRLHPGIAARDGVTAALLAEQGFTGPMEIFDGEYGFLNVYSERQYPKRMLDKLGERYEIMTAGFKAYACCGLLHTSIDAVTAILETKRIEPEDVKRITIKTNKQIARDYGKRYAPKSTIEAQFSVPYAVASAAIRGSAFVKDFSGRAITDRNILSFASKIRVVADGQVEKLLPRMFCVVAEVETKDCKKYRKLVRYPKGHPQNPMTSDELRTKFRELGALVLGRRRVDKIIRVVNDLDRLKRVTRLTNLLQSTRPRLRRA